MIDPTGMLGESSPYKSEFPSDKFITGLANMFANNCPDCPKPKYADEARYGSDGKYYMATPISEGSKKLEFLETQSIEVVNIKPSEKAMSNYNHMQAESRLHAAFSETKIGQEIGAFEKFAFIGIPLALATGGTGGFALSGEMTVGAIGGRMLTDATIQTAANFTTNGGNLGNALGGVNLTQTALAGVGMKYVGNSLISASTNISYNNQTSLLNGTISAQKFSTQAAAGILGGSIARGISGTPTFKSTVIGSYMQTTTRFGQTAGAAAATVLMNTPDYGSAVLQNKIP